MKIIICFFLFFIGCTHQTTNEITEQDLMFHIGWLADDKLNGRLAGTKDEFITAEKISHLFEQNGLGNFNNSCLQPFEFTSGSTAAEGSNIIVDNIALENNFEFLSFSSTDTVTGNIGFVGNGITEQTYNFDEYENVNIEGNIAFVLAGEPNEENWPLRKKAMNAREHGASAVLFIANENTSLEKYTSMKQKMFDNVGIPSAIISFSKAKSLGFTKGILLPNLIQTMKQNPHEPHSFETNITSTISVKMNSTKKTSHNVLGIYNNSLKKEYIILGAHMDHLGYGGQGSGSSAPEIHDVHNGADDNASGVSAILEIAEFLGRTQPILDCNILFVAFGAEEQGLIGSSYLAENLPFPKNQLKAMINLDMIGRMENQTLVLGAVGTAIEWKSIIEEITPYNLNIVVDNEGFGASDHQSFILEDVPSLFVFTGAHEDYHKPSDDIEKINSNGLLQVTEFVNELLFASSSAEQKITFKKINPRMQSGKRSSVKLGTIPDYTFNGDGMRIKGVSANSPAEMVGLQKNDIIMSLGGVEIHSIYDYMFALNELKIGKETVVEILRNNEKVHKNITPVKK